MNLPFVEKIKLPASLEEVTTRSPHEVDPRHVGAAPEAVEAIWESAVRLYKSRMHPAVQLCIRRHGEVVLDRSIGHASGNGPNDTDETPKVLATPETPFNIFSASKAVTAMLVHLLDERNQIRLDDRVCDYIPEFAAHGKFRITIRHILSHRAGMPMPPPEAMRLEYLAQPDEIVRILCNMPLATRPGQ